ncbi:MAG: site-specific integrase, partial [Acidimicrobiia bacterium]|nr:site-specific integrase [Acidimicrobiia bacterium]
MAHIRRHPVDNSKWQVRYVDPGKRERSKTFRRKVDAEKFLIQVESQKQRGEWIDPDLAATPFADWAHSWITTRTHLKPKTLDGYRSLLRIHIVPRFGAVRLDRIDGLSIEQWVADMQEAGLSASRIRQAHRVLSQILKAAVRARYIPANPAEGIPLPRKPRREQLFVNPVEVDRLADAVDARYRALIYVLSYGGLRWGEAAALRVKRVDVLRGRVDVNESLAEVGGDLHFGSTKNHRNRTVIIPAFLREMLNEHMVTFCGSDPDGLVFTASNGSAMRNSNFTKNVWQPAIAEAQLPERLRIHDLRHTAAALLISQGAHPEAIKRHLGHSSIVVTMDVYGHLFPSEAESLAEALDSLYAQNQTDKRRTKPSKGRIREKGKHPKSQLVLDFSEVGPVGLEPTTNGLKARCGA